MRRLVLIAALLFTAPVFAQDTPASGAAVHASGAAVHVATPTVTHKDAVPEGSVEEVMGAAAETIKTANEYFTGSKEGDGTAKAVGLSVLISVILKLLLALLKLTSPFWKQTRGKWVLRAITLAVGAAAAILANMAGGMEWWNAIIVFFSGPGSIVLTEYQKMVTKSKKEASSG